MTFREGDRVIAAEGIGGMIFDTVPKGTQGVVAAVRGFISSSYEVHFDNGRTETVRESQIAKLNKRW
jgi:hypothetical protein